MKAIVLHRHEIIHHGVKNIMSEHYDCDVIGCCNYSMATSYAYSGSCNLMFIQVPEFTDNLKEIAVTIPTICVSDSNKTDALRDAISMGASGYLLESDPIEEYILAIRMALESGKLRARAEDVKKLLEKIEYDKRVVIEAGSYLTDRDVEVLELLSLGKSNREIARTLSIAHGTVRNRVTDLLRKTNKDNRTALAIWAVTKGIVDSNI